MFSSALQVKVTQVPAEAPPVPPVPPAPEGVGAGLEGLRGLEDLRRLEELRHLEGLQHLPNEAAIADQVRAALDNAQLGIQDRFIFAPPGIPDELIGLVLGSLTLILLMIVGYPIARAIARRIDRSAVSPTPTADVTARLERIEHAVETMAVEIERISEGQRFTTRLLTEQTRGARAGFVNE